MPNLVNSSQQTKNREPTTVNKRQWRLRFTLIELLVVITLIGILIGVGAVSFSKAQQKARDHQRKKDLINIKTALVAYYQDHDHYPPECASPPCTASEYDSSSSGNWIPELVPDYLKELPNDPSQASIGSFLANIFRKPIPQNTPQPQVAAAGSLDPRVSLGSDDAEQRLDTNAVNLTSSDLELVLDSANQEIGMRFQMITIPQGATITNAYVEFTTDTTSSVAT